MEKIKLIKIYPGTLKIVKIVAQKIAKNSIKTYKKYVSSWSAAQAWRVAMATATAIVLAMALARAVPRREEVLPMTNHLQKHNPLIQKHVLVQLTLVTILLCFVSLET